MTNINRETLNMLEILPEEDQLLAKAFVKKMLLAWDPDFTKVTFEEKKSIEEAKNQIKNSESYSLEETLKILGIENEQ